MVSTISAFHCTLMFINPARLFHDFQNVEWFAQRWMICNYDVECILTTLNDLYYVEWFVLTWIFCSCNVEECVLTMLKDLPCCWMIWRVQWNFLLENILLKIASEFSLPWKFQQWTLPSEKTPHVETLLVIIALQQMKKNRLSLKSRITKIKGYWYGYFTKI